MKENEDHVKNKQGILEFDNAIVKRFLKSFVFSLMLFLFWGYFSFSHIRMLFNGFDLTQVLWLVYNVTISFLFLIRVKPVLVSMNLAHWIIALVTSFSGFFFSRLNISTNSIFLFISASLIGIAVLIGIMTAFTLGRSYDFLPALRQVKTKFVYRIVRHPMYLSSIAIKIGYILKYPSIYNILLLMVIVVLYDKRAKYEEEIMSNSESYLRYLKQVRYRFVPGLY